MNPLFGKPHDANRPKPAGQDAAADASSEEIMPDPQEHCRTLGVPDTVRPLALSLLRRASIQVRIGDVCLNFWPACNGGKDEDGAAQVLCASHNSFFFFLNPLSSSRLYAVKSVYRSALPATARPLVHAARRAAARRAPKIRHKSGQACHLLMMSAVRQQARRTPLRVRLPPLPLRRQPPRLRAQV